MKKMSMKHSSSVVVMAVAASMACSLVCRAGDEGAMAGCGGSCAVSAGAGAKAGEAAPAPVAAVNTAGLAALLRAKTPVVLLDARSGKWDDGKRIPGAKSVNAESTEAEVAAAAPDKNALVVTYCSNLKCPASNKLAEHLKAVGYTNVLEYHEGIGGWVEAGNAVEENKK